MAEDLDDWMGRVERSPTDEGLRAVFLDWLLEQGLTELAEWMRLSARHASAPLGFPELVRLREATARIPPRLRARLARAPVEECRPAVPLSFECPKRWEHMETTESPLVRRCGACERPVYWIETVDEAIEHARLGHCIAVAPGLERPPMPVRPWPVDLMPPPGTMAVPDPPDGPERPPGPHPDPPKASWWRRLLGW